MRTTEQLTVDIEAAGEDAVALVGGKGAQLGALTRIDGVAVPSGFVVTTAAYRRAQRGGAADALPADVEAAIRAALARHGDAHAAWAVRSSATAEDAAAASFAGQHDSFLGVVGPDAVLDHVRRVWASLDSERAVAYRAQAQTPGADGAMAVVVQRMVDARAAGVLFTADPVTGNRRVCAIEAVPGLGEALVAGRADPDILTVRDDRVTERTDRHAPPVLTDAQAIALTRIGRRIEAERGAPQDIEWCLTHDGDVAIVQSRPITTIFPPPAAPDDAPRVYVSVGHGQMMTDAMRPLGLSVFRLTAMPVMHEAGSRLWVEVTDRIASPSAGPNLIALMRTSDALIGDALQTVVDRGVVPLVEDDADAPPPRVPPAPEDPDPGLIPVLVAEAEASLAALQEAIAPLTGTALLDHLLGDIATFKALVFDPRSLPLIMVGMEAAWWLNDHLQDWLGETNAADVLTQSVDGNITSEMGLALLDVADAIRPHPAVLALLQDAGDDVLDVLTTVEGGAEARAAIDAFLERFGMRCVGEIDITRPRWHERPATLVPLILTNVRSFAPGESTRRFAAGRAAAEAKAAEVLERLRALPDGDAKAAETARMIDRVRTYSGYREYPKYHIISRYAVYKRALVREARRLVAASVLRAVEDAFDLTLQELREAAATGAADLARVDRRRALHARDAALTPPRVITSEGEAVTGTYRRGDLPDGALAGLAVSTGVVEGRARVIHDMDDAAVEPGDILVTAHTDPSWSPLFVAVAGLVTEVGGRMTHGAVVAREYGLPAVVGVDRATTLIRDGRRIRVNGTEGYVELL